MTKLENAKLFKEALDECVKETVQSMINSLNKELSCKHTNGYHEQKLSKWPISFDEQAGKTIYSPVIHRLCNDCQKLLEEIIV